MKKIFDEMSLQCRMDHMQPYVESLIRIMPKAWTESEAMRERILELESHSFSTEQEDK